jgi:hypothetical protein
MERNACALEARANPGALHSVPARGARAFTPCRFRPAQKEDRMLFHVTMRHTASECPGYQREKIPLLLQWREQREKLSKQFNVKVLGMYNALPQHLEFAIIEADSPASVAFFLSTGPVKVDFEVHAVEAEDTLMEAIKKMMAQAGG